MTDEPEGDPTVILVTGGTGNVGANIVRQLLDAGEQVRVVTRAPGEHSLPGEAEVVRGDLSRPETLPAALAGIEQVFLFPVFDAIAGFLRAGRQAGLRHVVLLSSAAAGFPSRGWIGEQHLRAEQVVASSGLPWTFVRPDAFMTNDLAWAPQIAGGGVVRGAYGEAALAPVDPRDIAAVAVHALLEERAGETYTVTGPQSLTQLDRVRIIGEAIGRPVRFEELPRDTVRQQMVQHGMPAPAADELLDGLAARVGEPAATLPTVEELTGRRAFTYAEWVSLHRAAFAPTVTS
ncbi:NAD(P)H-binding protein [Nonomuraea phyllanthi]|nr:NAD(P)H-binding protein [Nonomuraea phyllanthi]